MKDYYNYSVIVRDAQTDKEIVKSKVKEVEQTDGTITIDCDLKLFDYIDKVKVVLYKGDDVISYMGTIRRALYSNTEVTIALYKGQNIQNRSDQRYLLEANVYVIRYLKKGELTELNPPIFSRLLDISSKGARIQLSDNYFEVGDYIAFKFVDKSVEKLMLAKVVRVALAEKYNYQYGLELIDNNH